MASKTLDVSDLYAAGTTVSVVPQPRGASPWDGTGTPPGPVITTAVVATSGQVTFTGLADDTAYVVTAGGVSRSFRSDPASSSSSGSAASASGRTTQQSLADELRDRNGLAVTMVKNGAHRAAYDDATEIIETWTNTSAWTMTGSGIQASGGKAYAGVGYTTGNAIGTRPFPIADTDRFRLVTTIIVPATPTNKTTYFGLSCDSAASTADNLFMGISGSTSPAGKVAFAVGANWIANGVTNTLDGGATQVQLTTGTYLVTITADETQISFTIYALTGTLAGQEWEKRVLRSAKPAGKTLSYITAFIPDSATTAGNAMGPIGAKLSSGTLRTRTPVEGQGPTAAYVSSPTTGDRWRIALPTNHDTRKPAPVVLYQHQASTGNERGPVNEARLIPTAQALAAAGYIFASAQDGANTTGYPTANYTGDRWGNQAAMDNLTELYRYIRDHYATGPVLLLATSMGALTSLNLLARSAIPNIAGLYVIDGFADLSKASLLGTNLAGSAYAAYGAAADGSDMAAKSVGFNPMDRLGSDFRGVPVRWSGSPADTTVSSTLHGQAMVAKLAPYADAQFAATTLGHLDASHYDPTGIVNFFNAALL